MKYYYLNDLNIVTRGEGWTFDMFQNGDWVPEPEPYTRDRQVGYDPTEDPDSPYGFGNTEIMNCIEEITEEKATKIISGVPEKTMLHGRTHWRYKKDSIQ